MDTLWNNIVSKLGIEKSIKEIFYKDKFEDNREMIEKVVEAVAKKVMKQSVCKDDKNEDKGRYSVITSILVLLPPLDTLHKILPDREDNFLEFINKISNDLSLNHLQAIYDDVELLKYKRDGQGRLKYDGQGNRIEKKGPIKNDIDNLLKKINDIKIKKEKT